MINRYKDLDKVLLVTALLILLLGLLTIYSATQSKGLVFSESYVLRQASWMLIGMILLILMIKISYQRFVDLSYIFYGINVILLISVLIIGHVRMGAQRWFAIGSFAFQPSEFVKICLILALSAYVGYKRRAMFGLKSLIVPCVLLGVPFLFVLLQPDLGTALLLLPISFAVLFVGGVGLKYLAGMVLIGLAGLPFFWQILHDYQRQRLLVFLNPNIDPLGAGYTIIQSKIAVGSGGLLGKGWLAGTQNQLNFLPERHTDFIFSVIGEEWGFLGAAALVLLYLLIIKRACGIAASTSDRYGKCIATGIAVMLGLQAIINISMTIGLMPVVGVPLPLVSYGGSSLLATLAAIGLLINVGMRRLTF